MKVDITEESLDKALKERVYEGFSNHATASVGSDGNIQDITLIARHEDLFLGVFHGKTFWGGLHVKYLYVDPDSRGQGIGKQLMSTAFKQAIALGCRFAFVETLDFQAVDFYKRLGFIEEYVRTGYDKDASFHYLRKDFIGQQGLEND